MNKKTRSFYYNLFSKLSKSIDNLIHEISKHNMGDKATDNWTVKDVLSHIAFWHKYYAQNYKALSKGKQPFVFTSKGGSTRNQEGVESLKKLSKRQLVQSLQNSQKSLYRSILIYKVSEMNYTDRRSYKTEDFLEGIIAHIERHTLQIKKAK